MKKTKSIGEDNITEESERKKTERSHLHWEDWVKRNVREINVYFKYLSGWGGGLT